MERSQVLDVMGQLKLYGSEGAARHRFEGAPERGL